MNKRKLKDLVGKKIIFENRESIVISYNTKKELFTLLSLKVNNNFEEIKVNKKYHLTSNYIIDNVNNFKIKDFI